MFLRKIGNEGHIDFFHRQIAKAVVKKYLESDSVRVAYHTRLAQFYGRQADPTSSFNFTIDGNGMFSHMKDHVKWILTAIYSRKCSKGDLRTSLSPIEEQPLGRPIEDLVQPWLHPSKSKVSCR